KGTVDGLTSYLQQHSKVIYPSPTDPISQMTYYEPLGLADIYLSYPGLITDTGRKIVKELAYDNDIEIKQDFTLETKYYNQNTSILIKSKKYGNIGKLSKNCVNKLSKRHLENIHFDCVSFCIIEYYQADRSFY